jgi:hypothetical protein
MTWRQLYIVEWTGRWSTGTHGSKPVKVVAVNMREALDIAYAEAKTWRDFQPDSLGPSLVKREGQVVIQNDEGIQQPHVRGFGG